eukprot:gb/GEZN01011343.1/.p1 GENE.gb/GEZN01011343.1/~~gb/GEZN01011343.1/.p1  ORF type:complete len:303 (+),score=16.38 gb/GEZN01011343.1/:43-909(+)
MPPKKVRCKAVTKQSRRCTKPSYSLLGHGYCTVHAKQATAKDLPEVDPEDVEVVGCDDPDARWQRAKETGLLIDVLDAEGMQPREQKAVGGKENLPSLKSQGASAFLSKQSPAHFKTPRVPLSNRRANSRRRSSQNANKGGTSAGLGNSRSESRRRNWTPRQLLSSIQENQSPSYSKILSASPAPAVTSLHRSSQRHPSASQKKAPRQSQPGVVCSFFPIGRCNYASNCRFSHEVLQSYADTRLSTPCRFHSLGSCTRGFQCSFEHEAVEKTSTDVTVVDCTAQPSKV